MVSYADGHIATILNGFTSRPADCERPLALGWTPLREHITISAAHSQPIPYVRQVQPSWLA